MNAWEVLRQTEPEPYDDRELTERELNARYNPKRENKRKRQRWMSQAVADEMGLNKNRIVVNDNADLFEKYLGMYWPAMGYLQLDPKVMDRFDSHFTTPAHELAHVADTAYTGEIPKSHHAYYGDFTRDFGHQLRAQREIEQLGSTSPEDLRAFPWLEQVKPLSSNKLANPWQFFHEKQALPEDLWNEITGAKRKELRKTIP